MNQNELFEKSKEIIPGGVHSPVRSFKGLHTGPRFMKKASGAYIWDVEDKNYIDFCMSFGPLILGHKNEKVKEAVTQQLDRGWSYGSCEPYSLELAEYLVEKVKPIEQIRFMNSGTEAVMTALRIARGYTKKNKVVKFNGCYHGHLDSLLIKAGSGLAGEAESSSLGVPQSIAKDTLIVELGDLEALQRVFKEHNDIAAIIVEPLAANNGLLPQSQSYLEALRTICTDHGALLIFDEVISGFRMGFGGMAEKTQITPDLITYGKIIGGGMPVGAVAGKKEMMQMLAPVGGVYQAGTLSANPLAMVAGLTTLKQLDEKAYQNLENYTKNIVDIFKSWLKVFEGGKYSHINFTSSGSLFWSCPGDLPKNASEIPSELGKDFYHIFKVLLERGIYLAPNAYEVGFISLAHDNTVQDDLAKRLGL